MILVFFLMSDVTSVEIDNKLDDNWHDDRARLRGIIAVMVRSKMSSRPTYISFLKTM